MNRTPMIAFAALVVLTALLTGSNGFTGDVKLAQRDDARSGGGIATLTVKQTLTPPWAADDGMISHRDVTGLGPMSAHDAWVMRGDADGVIHKQVIGLLGTCDDIVDCAAHAADTCEDLGYGEPTNVSLGTNGTCDYTCGNGVQGTVTCLDD